MLLGKSTWYQLTLPNPPMFWEKWIVENVFGKTLFNLFHKKRIREKH